jgi:hypothetical protein
MPRFTSRRSIRHSKGEKSSLEFDFDFRPNSYWNHEETLSEILSNVKGRLRREMIADVLTAEGDKRRIYDELLGELDPQLFEADGGPGFREVMGKMDPRWMGGEYLPDMHPGEVEIARVSLESITYDVYSIRARRANGLIHYRIVDEYTSNWLLKLASSREPLRLAELIVLIDTARIESCEWDDLTDWLRDGTARDDDVKVAARFVSVSSVFYPELERYYAAKAEAWARRWRASHPED